MLSLSVVSLVIIILLLLFAIIQSDKIALITRNLFEIVVVLDKKGNWLFYNDNLIKISGFTKKELDKLTLFDLVNPEHRDIVKDNFKKRIKGEELSQRYEIKGLLKNGGTKWVQIKSKKINWFGKAAVLIFMEDIDEIKRYESALERSEKRNRELIENMTEGIILFDDDKRVSLINVSFTKITGLSPEDVLGKKYTAVMKNVNGQPLFEPLSEISTVNRTIEKCEQKIFTGSSKVKTIILSASAIITTKQYLAGYIVVINDITSIINLQKQAIISEKLETLGRTAGMIAHDLNNILSGIVTMPDLMLMNMSEDDPNRETLEIIKDSGRQAASTIDDLLTYSRRSVAIYEPLYLGDVIDEYMSSFEFKHLKNRHPNITITASEINGNCVIKGSKLHIRKTISNLIQNAMEAMQDSGGDVEISLKRKIKENRAYALLKITDTGPGIPKHSKDKIFEPFYTKKVMGISGTGLGLTIVNSTVSDHGGTIEVYSREGIGTVFKIWLPITNEIPTEARAKNLSNRTINGNGELILIVDDNSLQRKMLQKSLAAINYRTLYAESGEEAIPIFQTRKDIDLVILDMVLENGMNGLDTCKKMLKINPNARILFLSGFAENDRIKEAVEIGSGQFEKKPYSLPSLSTKINILLNGKDDIIGK